MGAYSLNQTQSYQSKAVFVSSGAADSDQLTSGSIRQLSRIQSVNWDISYPVDQPTYVDAGTEAYMPVSSSLDLSLSWYHTNGRNEQALGLMDTVGPSGTLAFNLDQEKAIYVSIENTPGVDAIGSTGYGQSKTVLGIAQGLMTNYQIGASIGSLVKAQTTMDCFTAFIYTGASGNAVAAVNPRDGVQRTGLFSLPQAFAQYDPAATGLNDPVAAIGARDMYMLFPVGTPFGITFSGSQTCYLQSFQATMTFPRRERKPLGSVYPDTRGVFYPIEVNLTTEAIVNRYQKDYLDRINCLATGFTIQVVVKQPCSNAVLFGLYFDNLQLTSQSFSSSIGPVDVVSLQWKGLLTGPDSTFFNPAVSYLINQDTTGAWGTTW